MKKLGKAVLGLVAAVAMLVTGLVAPLTAVAAETTTITITGATAGDTFSAYRLFNVTTSKTGEGTAQKTNYAYTEVSAAKTAIVRNAYNSLVENDQKIADTATVPEIVTTISGNTSLDVVKFAQAIKAGIASANPKITADLNATVADSATTATLSGDAGYYIIEQTNDVTGKDQAASALIVNTAGQDKLEVVAKSDKPTQEKKVKEKNDTTGVETGWQDGADYDIGDWVPFKITGKLPSDSDFASKFAAYKTYKFVFHDTASTGLTFDETKVPADKKLAVKVGSTVIPATVTTADGAHTNWTLKTTGITADETFNVEFTDIKSLLDENGAAVTVGAGTEISVEYYMQLNDDAVIKSAGNPNESYLEYSNNPNSEGTGKTAPDKVVVWTYQLTANKKAENKNGADLPGASFTLYKKDSSNNWNEVKTIPAGETVKFEFKGVDAGEYKLEEKSAPSGYNKAADVFFTVKATYDTNSADPKLISLEVTDVTGGDLTADKDTGVIETTIVNKSGSQLPSTGGMGTVILYALGAAFVAAAGAWFAFRRRLSNR